jgi:hypothetical protein
LIETCGREWQRSGCRKSNFNKKMGYALLFFKSPTGTTLELRVSSNVSTQINRVQNVDVRKTICGEAIAGWKEEDGSETGMALVEVISSSA